MVLNPLDAVQAQYITDNIPKAVNNVNLTRIAITGGIVVVLCVAVFIKSQQVLTQGVYEAESNSLYVSLFKKGTSYHKWGTIDNTTSKFLFLFLT